MGWGSSLRKALVVLGTPSKAQGRGDPGAPRPGCGAGRDWALAPTLWPPAPRESQGSGQEAWGSVPTVTTRDLADKEALLCDCQAGLRQEGVLGIEVGPAGGGLWGPVPTP